MIILISLGIYNKTPTPVRLAKKESWSERNYGLIMTVLFSILLILVMALFITLCFAFTGNTEANQYYYHMEG